jgi:hypothetical protein
LLLAALLPPLPLPSVLLLTLQYAPPSCPRWWIILCRTTIFLCLLVCELMPSTWSMLCSEELKLIASSFRVRWLR